MRNLLLLPLSFLLSLPLSYGQAVAAFINEVNYTASHPTDRGLEIAGEAASDLDGWSVVIYNADGTVNYVKNIYSEIIPDQQNGYGTIWVEMEQGGGDGVALVDPVGSAIRFVSYGSALSILAIEGAASGLTSEFIGAQILPDAALQLSGTGMTYLDFAWSVSESFTPNEVNTNQVMGLIPPLFMQSDNEEGVLDYNTENQLIRSGESGQGMSFDLYPNPAVANLNLNFNTDFSDGTIQIFNLSGQLVLSVEISSSSRGESIDISQLQTGQYLVNIFNENYNEAKWLVKN
jgi:Secretion system C-terminal sorting domain